MAAVLFLGWWWIDLTLQRPALSGVITSVGLACCELSLCSFRLANVFGLTGAYSTTESVYNHGLHVGEIVVLLPFVRLCILKRYEVLADSRISVSFCATVEVSHVRADSHADVTSFSRTMRNIWYICCNSEHLRVQVQHSPQPSLQWGSEMPPHTHTHRSHTRHHSCKQYSTGAHAKQTPRPFRKAVLLTTTACTVMPTPLSPGLAPIVCGEQSSACWLTCKQRAIRCKHMQLAGAHSKRSFCWLGARSSCCWRNICQRIHNYFQWHGHGAMSRHATDGAS